MGPQQSGGTEFEHSTLNLRLLKGHWSGSNSEGPLGSLQKYVQIIFGGKHHQLRAMQPQHIKFKQIGAYNQDHCKHARKHHELEKIEKKNPVQISKRVELFKC